MKKIIALLIIPAITVFAFSGSALAKRRPVLTADLGFVNINNLPTGSNQINPIRLQAIRETATTLGTRGALAWRSLQIDDTLKQESNYLNQVFNFNQLLMNRNVIPPVIVESDNNLNLANPDTIRLDSKTYKIIKPAHFVTAAPNWRTYLWMDYKKPDMPDHSLLPKTQAEAMVWNDYLKKGWQQGLQQADEIFQINLNRLKRDYKGMLLYRKLLAQNMVSAPQVATADLGVTGDGHELQIGDKIIRITSQSELQPNSSKWKPVLTK